MHNHSMLLIDIGNSFAKFGMLESPGRISLLARIPVSDLSDTDKLRAVFGRNLQAKIALISCVGPESVLRDVSHALSEMLGVETHRVLSAAEDCGVFNCYDEPVTLGADRWCAMIGARQLCRSAFCVVDLGSAVTIDLIAQDGRFKGGVILPGWRAWNVALARETELALAIAQLDSQPGCSTSSAIAAGFVNAVVGSVEQLIQQFTRGEKDKPMIFLTGGDAEMFAKFIHFPYRHEPELVLHGLATIGMTL